MGSDIKEMIDPIKREMEIGHFLNKKIAIDAFNTIYQFLSIIKGSDGKPLKNFKGEITSHLSGLLYRNTMFLENNIKPIYCFDGIEKSKKLRWETRKNNSSVRITKYIIESTKELLNHMGIPYVQGTAEGEAQCCLLNIRNQCFSVASQDYDCLAFGGKRLIRNFAINAKRKKGDTYITLPIDFISSQKFFDFHDITREQLVDIIILSGNDFYPGISGFGCNTSLKIIKEYGTIVNYIEDVYDKVIVIIKKNGISYSESSAFLKDIIEIRKIFLNPNVNENYKIRYRKPDFNELKSFLTRNNFSSIRVENVIKRLEKTCVNKKQINLEKFW